MLEFTQNEVEKDLSDYYRHSDRREISKITGIYESVVKGMINPDGERKSAAFTFLQMQCALDEIDSERGDQHLQKVLQFRELSKKRKPGALCLETQAGNVATEFAQFTVAVFADKPLETQLSEIDDVIREAERFKQGLIDRLAKDSTKQEVFDSVFS
jgi:hypothetical protein